LTEPTKEATTIHAGYPRANTLENLEKCLEKLSGGSSYCYRGVNLWIAPDGYLEVRVHPEWRDDEGLSVLDDVSYAHHVLAHAAGVSSRMEALLRDHPKRFVRIHDDETGFTSLFYLRRDGLLTWSVELL
jgi:hypothetical protein